MAVFCRERAVLIQAILARDLNSAGIAFPGPDLAIDFNSSDSSIILDCQAVIFERQQLIPSKRNIVACYHLLSFFSEEYHFISPYRQRLLPFYKGMEEHNFYRKNAYMHKF
jgi:hypothetical protein